MLADVVDLLACPTCGAELRIEAAAVRCPGGHSFDVARQGYVSLLAAGADPGAGDTAAMVEARAAFLALPHYQPIRDAVVGRAPATTTVVVDVGAGPAVYLAAVLDRLPAASGLAVDVSKFAARKAARAHRRAGAIVADGRWPLPIRSAVADLVLNVFAPRNARELRRILRPEGRLLVVAPTERHLAEVVAPLGLLTVHPGKDAHIDERLEPHFTRADQTTCEFTMSLSSIEIEHLVRMGPSAFHQDAAALRARIESLSAPVTITASVTVTTYRPRPADM